MTASLKGRSVLVTGGSKGIGKGIARVFAQAGAKVAIMARHLDHAQASAQDIGHGAIGVAGDVTSLSSLEMVMNAVALQHGGIDVLCANAGIFPAARLEEMSEAQWDEVMDTNLKGTFLTLKAAIPYLKKSDQGRVIITSSITGPTRSPPSSSPISPITATPARAASLITPCASRWRRSVSRSRRSWPANGCARS